MPETPGNLKDFKGSGEVCASDDAKIPRNSWEIYGRLTKNLGNSVFCLYSSFSDLAKFVHWTMQKFLGICGKFTDA